jgi:hypothetical protein
LACVSHQVYFLPVLHTIDKAIPIAGDEHEPIIRPCNLKREIYSQGLDPAKPELSFCQDAHVL